ncbi:hypothetical protein HELRODRAFT_164412 [Helobdella robusta]|uniref:Homeobox domain-containing protein n=1 Tax=Helobdella robusta TaxID=6412 RepID=T1EVE2_HELRO|nr:hypothetical protein HELRODRAFT_164412 [Helobdella robusta]ESN94554.1 hypothetical protein HELRODRAFT_164412 [Helobdella robusta]
MSQQLPIKNSISSNNNNSISNTNNNLNTPQNFQNIDGNANQSLPTSNFQSPANDSTSTTKSHGQNFVACQQQTTLNNSTRVVKKRIILSNDRTSILENYYQNNFNFPYPDLETRESLASQCGISCSQVNKWFSNRRNKDKNTRSLTDIANVRGRKGT